MDGWKNWKSCKAFLFSVSLQGSVHACPHQVFVSIGTPPGSFVALNVEHCCLGPAGNGSCPIPKHFATQTVMPGDTENRTVVALKLVLCMM